MSTGLTPDLVRDMIDAGQKQADIARQFGVSRQYVSKLAKKAGHESPFKVLHDNLPWDVPGEYTDNTLWKNLRRHGILMTTGHLGEPDRVHLRGLYRKLGLFNQVVDFDPSYPPLPGLSSTPGFAYVPRTERDEDFMVKIRPGTNITRIGDRIWRMPPEIP